MKRNFDGYRFIENLDQGPGVRTKNWSGYDRNNRIRNSEIDFNAHLVKKEVVLAVCKEGSRLLHVEALLAVEDGLHGEGGGGGGGGGLCVVAVRVVHGVLPVSTVVVRLRDINTFKSSISSNI